MDSRTYAQPKKVPAFSVMPVRKPAPHRRSLLRDVGEGHAGFDFGSISLFSGNENRVQTKLTIGKPGDRYEQEADSMADRVMSMPDPNVQRKCAECKEEENLQRQPEEEEDKELIQSKELRRQPEEEEDEEIATMSNEVRREVDEEEEEEISPMSNELRRETDEEEEETVSPKSLSGGTPQVTPEIQNSISSMKGGGQPLPDSTRAFFEPRFKRDFSRVRLHTDSRAAEIAKSINARAFTVGRNIAFGAGQYSPDASSGKRLLAHELTHTVQQGRIKKEALIGQSSEKTMAMKKEKGEDKDPDTKIKSNTHFSFTMIRSAKEPPAELVGKRHCPAPIPSRQRHRRLDSSAAQIAAMSACNWGITNPDRLGVRTTTCRDGANWRLRVRRVNSVIRLYSRQLLGQNEPIPGVNTTSANFCDQARELNALGACPGKWYMIRAVRAHEEVHVNEWRNNFNNDWSALQATIEGLSVPASGPTLTRAAATTALRSLPAFRNSLLTTSASGNFPTFWGIPDPNPNTNAAERAIVKPRIIWICKRAKWDRWIPAGCPTCVGVGIT